MPSLQLERDMIRRMVETRRDLHRHPELSGEEFETQERIEKRLRELELEPKRLGRTGVIADLPAESPKTGVPAVALRADTDALPIREETGLPFASTADGIMHACGHDGHTAMLLGAADALRRHPLPAPVRLIFQPAEEVATGALEMIEAGALAGVGSIFGVHLDRHFATGKLIVTPGPVNASTDAFTVRITGQNAHAARPHEGLDALLVGSATVMAIQSIVAREIDPSQPAVITVGTFHGGEAPNAIAGEAILQGTIRALSPEVREQLKSALRRVVESVAAAHGAAASFEIGAGTPPLINPEEATGVARRAAVDIVGEDGVERLDPPIMGGEDFGYFLDRVTGCYIRIGAAFSDRENFPVHSSRFDFNESALEIGAAYLARVAVLAGAELDGT